jgi:hypothetical protein
LCCDAFGVLPPISKLTAAQVQYYFISGYTAKVAGKREHTAKVAGEVECRAKVAGEMEYLPTLLVVNNSLLVSR